MFVMQKHNTALMQHFQVMMCQKIFWDTFFATLEILVTFEKRNMHKFTERTVAVSPILEALGQQQQQQVTTTY